MVSFIILLSAAFGFYILSRKQKPVQANIDYPKIDNKQSSNKLKEFIYTPDTVKRIGVFRNGTKPPSYAETLTKSRHTKQLVHIGKFGGNTYDYDDVEYKCLNCGLISQTHGNSLTVWEDPTFIVGPVL